MPNEVSWSLQDILLPSASWDLEDLNEGEIRVSLDVKILNREQEPGILTSECALTMDLHTSEAETEDSKGQVRLKIVLITDLEGASLRHIRGTPELDKRFKGYVVQTLFGYARTTVLRIGQDAGLQNSLLLPEMRRVTVDELREPEDALPQAEHATSLPD